MYLDAVSYTHLKPGKSDYPQNSNTISPDKKLEKYWKKVFKPLKNEEIEITNITVSDNVCTINYLMPYCTSSEEYIFQADIDKEKAVDGFCNTVEEKANEMIVMIKECSNIRNLF